MPLESSKAFTRWLKRLKLSYSQASAALGICTSAVGFYNRGVRKTKKDDVTEKEVEVPKSILLACRAIEKKLPPIK